MQLVVFEDAGYRNLLPLVYTRAAFDLRCGFDGLLEKIESTTERGADALFVRGNIAAAIAERQGRTVNETPGGNDQLWVNGRLLLRRKLDLALGAAAWKGDTLLAARLDAKTAAGLTSEVLLRPSRLKSALSHCRKESIANGDASPIDYPWQLVRENGAEIIRRFDALEPEIIGQVDPCIHFVNEPAIHVGPGSTVKPGVVLDAEDGPIWIGENVIIHPNATISGPCYVGDDCVIQPGASIRGGCSIGPACKIGGEIEGTIFQGYSNKQHDGFLGHAYVGAWVNLGAGTVNSDLKNTYGPVSVPINGEPTDTGLTFVGAFIGDHTKTGIRVALPTGCVIGFASNVITSRYAPTFVPSFCWLTDDGKETNDPTRALAVARKVLARRNRRLSATEETLFLSVAAEAQRHEAAQ